MRIAACPHCGQQVPVDPLLAGETVDCPGCAGEFVMPMAPGSKITFEPMINKIETVTRARVSNGARYDLFHFVVAASLAAIAGGSVVGFASWNAMGEEWFVSAFGFGVPGVTKAGTLAAVACAASVVFLMAMSNQQVKQ